MLLRICALIGALATVAFGGNWQTYDQAPHHPQSPAPSPRQPLPRPVIFQPQVDPPQSLVTNRCPLQPTDLLFLADGSGSVGSYAFQAEVMNFTSSFVEPFIIGPQDTRVALIQFSDKQRNEFGFDAYWDRASVTHALRSTRHMNGRTSTGAAIDLMTSQGFSTANGARPLSNNVARVAIVITDGHSQDDVIGPASRARAAGIRIFAIGVTDRINDYELAQIVGPNGRYYHVNEFAKLNNELRSLIQQEACPCNPSNHDGCSLHLNEVCGWGAGALLCQCPPGNSRDPFDRYCRQPRPVTPAPTPRPITRPYVPPVVTYPPPVVYPTAAVTWPSVGTYPPPVTYPTTVTYPPVTYPVTYPPPTTTLNPDLFFCTVNNYCSYRRNEICAGGKCVCRLEDRRQVNTNICMSVEPINMRIRVIRRGPRTLYWTTEYGDDRNPYQIEISELFESGINRAIDSTPSDVSKNYVDVEVESIQPPRLFNSSWSSGLIFNFTNYVQPGQIQGRRLWEELLASIIRSGYSIGGTDLYIDPYQETWPFVTIRPDSLICGNDRCNTTAGEICIAQRICACSPGKRQRAKGTQCFDVDGFTFPIWVVRKGAFELLYNNTFANPQEPLHRQYVDLFKLGSSHTYEVTSLENRFVGTEVVDIVNPLMVNGSLDKGIMYNMTAYFQKGTGVKAEDAYKQFLRAIRQQFGNYVGNTDLRIGDWQADPFSACYRSNCDAKARCIPLSRYEYRCTCPEEYNDISPDKFNQPGRICEMERGENECANGRNDCHPFAECFDTENGYTCVCPQPKYRDQSGPNAREGSICVENYCLDNPCSGNTTCENEQGGAECICKNNYIDVRNVVSRGLVNSIPFTVDCLHVTDTNECSLGLDDCHPIAICTDLPIGFNCRCPSGYEVDPARPGRTCAGAITSCARCNGHGDCVVENDVEKCRCHTWFSGETCGTDLRMILAIILAILFLLLTLCCLLYFCLKCRCTKTRKVAGAAGGMVPWGTLKDTDSADMRSGLARDSDYYKQLTIPRARLREGEGGGLGGYLDDRASMSSEGSDESGSSGGSDQMNERIERRVTTTKTTTTSQTGADGQTHSATTYTAYPSESSQMASGSAFATSGSSSAFTSGAPQTSTTSVSFNKLRP